MVLVIYLWVVKLLANVDCINWLLDKFKLNIIAFSSLNFLYFNSHKKFNILSKAILVTNFVLLDSFLPIICIPLCNIQKGFLFCFKWDELLNLTKNVSFYNEILQQGFGTHTRFPTHSSFLPGCVQHLRPF